MLIDLKLKLLEAIYKFYDEYAKGYFSVCVPGCCKCCTTSVLTTTLECFYIISYLRSQGKLSLIKRLSGLSEKGYLRPTITTNERAYKCLNRIVPEEGDDNYLVEPCPFLHEGKCLIYQVRPFGCRSFFSEVRCEDSLEAIINPKLLTINILFLQIIEDIDIKGLFGNMIDIILFLSNSKNLEHYRQSEGISPSSILLPNRPIPGFLIPPNHRQEVNMVLNRLYNTKINDIDFKTKLMELKQAFLKNT
ncbi:MAG: hypothetical protein LWW78_06665 [Deltaproteobacteria bacterium]|nr:hypothetical protein [Deltaproteobacteria bacterium]